MSEASTSPAIEAQGVSYAYPDGVTAVAELSFRALPGEFVAVIGANGAGKTTLMKLLMRLLRPQQGCVRLDGHDVAGLRPADLYRRIGMVFQNPADQLFGPTVENDVAFGPRNLGLGEAEVAQRVAESLAAMDALALRERPVHHLSFGQQKRVCLAGVLAMRPAVLVLDEPTAGLDPAAEARMIELLLRLVRVQKTTLILCTHAVDLLPVAADRICVLCDGRIVHDGPPREVFADPERMAQAGLRVPIVAQVFIALEARHGLACNPLPLTMEEGRQQILRWVAEGMLGGVKKVGG